MREINLDERLSEINNLKWLPWIGKNYLKSNSKLMILGESHYLCNGDSPNDYGIDFTRNFITHHQNEQDETKVIRNLERTILNKDSDEDISLEKKLTLSNSFVYQVIIQKLLNANSERPEFDDYINGWSIILETIKILKPKTIISLGVQACDALLDLEYDGLSIEKYKKYDELINGSYPRYCKIQLDDNFIDIIFLRHTSGTGNGYDPKEWHKFLKKYFDVSEYKKEIKL